VPAAGCRRGRPGPRSEQVAVRTSCEHLFVSESEYKPLVKKKGRPPVVSGEDVTRVCRRHGPTVHHRYADGRLRCKRCVGEAVTRRHQRLKRMLVDEFGGGCAVCGYNRTPYNLHFHHVDPSTKSFSMHMGVGKALATFREEAKKCVLVCANCHGEIEAGLIESPAPGSVYRSAA
jgi:hypothetical protein